MSLLTRLKERKLVQWALAYIAGAWVVLQVMDVVAEPLSLSAPFQLGILIVVGAGFFVTLVLAWYHGEKGSQRVGGMELVALAVIFAATGLFLRTLPNREFDTGGESDPPGGFRVSLVAQLYENPAVAVLPLANMGGEDDQSFVDGLHGEVLSNLGKIGALTVISRQSVLQYRDSEKTIREIGDELDADAVLEGSVRKAGDRLRITAQLIHAGSDAQLWTETFDDELTVENIFDIQERRGGAPTT
jgi:TolB-like protein